ncbi:helix-turn-helix transcriptional regulator [Streptomyces microflavus]|uniref:helix-turn-helix domain-containing protein n=1 Tax=Streptomyces microflavus TaxID=1919 RepID=UPI00331BA937
MPTTHATESDLQEDRTQQFARYIRAAVTSAGYDIDSPRGGGKKALAKAAGMSQTSVGRMLAGQTMPDPAVLERLAEVLHLPLHELLVRSGLISGKSRALIEGAFAEGEKIWLSPEVAARRLGIRDAENIAFFERTVQMLLDREKG